MLVITIDDYVGEWRQKANEQNLDMSIVCQKSSENTISVIDSTATFVVNGGTIKNEDTKSKLIGTFKNDGSILWYDGPNFFATWVRTGNICISF